MSENRPPLGLSTTHGLILCGDCWAVLAKELPEEGLRARAAPGTLRQELLCDNCTTLLRKGALALALVLNPGREEIGSLWGDDYLE